MKLKIILVSLVVLFVLSISMSRTETKQEGIRRPSPGSVAAETQVQLLVEDEWRNVPVSVGALEYEEEELEQLHRETEKVWIEN